ncbi:MAG: hypothetical protein ABSD59_21005 [Terracidiphilus sp.]|jgi:hypothetical protein
MIPIEYSMALVNHLWQSTVVVGVAWLLAAALRKNHARVRYWVWMAASLKFLLPFSLLMGAGEWVRTLMPATAVVRPTVANAMEQITQPFAGAQFLDVGPSIVAGHDGLLLALNGWLVAFVAVWACGVLVVSTRFARGWWRVYVAKRAAQKTSNRRSFDSVAAAIFAQDDNYIVNNYK